MLLVFHFFFLRSFRLAAAFEALPLFLQGRSPRILQYAGIDSLWCRPYQSIEVSGDQSSFTNALLLVTYDGAHFTGWSSANDDRKVTETRVMIPSTKSGRKKRKRGPLPAGSGFVRSVQGELVYCLSKLYGNVDPSRIVVEGCSRTDKGVSCVHQVVQIYCLKSEMGTTGDESISGEKTPHPRNATDATAFESLPMTLSKLAFSLNRMLANDVRVRAIAVPPSLYPVFHPSMSALRKTYVYTFSTGVRPDPTQRRRVWHVPNFQFSGHVNEICSILEGRHSYVAFRGAPRSASDKMKYQAQNTMSHIHSVKIEKVSTWFETDTFTIEVTGDRFLYKQVRFMVGAIVACGQGVLSKDQTQEMLLTGKREVSFECAPARGLVLNMVQYNDPIDWLPANE